MRVGLIGLTCMALASCSTRAPAPAPPQQVGPIGAADTCGASPYLYLIGEDATALERVLILRAVRVNWPEDAPDGSSRPERLNFNISQSGVIQTITCG